jgi:carboxymethylenebutenolidase
MWRVMSLLMVLPALLLAESLRMDDLHDWQDDNWWQQGELAAVVNHAVTQQWHEMSHGEFVTPLLIARPQDSQRYPAVLFIHGRRGLDDLVQQHIVRLAARGFVVAAPDIYSGRFIEKFPLAHDYEIEGDVAIALDALVAREDIIGKNACIYSHTRGGYYALKAAVTQQRQHRGLSCYVSYYPHLQDPNLPEPMQVYRYASEIDQLILPTLIFMGDQEQYQRRRSIETAVTAMRDKRRDVALVTYPGVGRGFDFRPPPVRTFADDLASRDAIQRASDFMRLHLTGHRDELASHREQAGKED